MNSTIHHLVTSSIPGGFERRTSTACICVTCISFPRQAQRPGLYLAFYDLQDPNVPSSLRHWVPAAVNLSLPHTTFILLMRTKVYGYSLHGESLSPTHPPESWYSHIYVTQHCDYLKSCLIIFGLRSDFYNGARTTSVMQLRGEVFREKLKLSM